MNKTQDADTIFFSLKKNNEWIRRATCGLDKRYNIIITQYNQVLTVSGHHNLSIHNNMIYPYLYERLALKYYPYG